MAAFLPIAMMVALAAGVVIAPAQAHEITTRLVSCSEGDCLIVRGHRRSIKEQVRINDHGVETQGGRLWQVRLPLSAVRNWSAPFARTLLVTIVDPAGTAERSEAARLPVGLLGHDVQLASLVVRAR